ncbi:MAG: CapA family protein [Armatimonadota bacterium]
MLTRWLLLLLLMCGSAVMAAEPSVVLAAMGDVMLARTVPGQVAAHGAAWLWEPLAAWLDGADIRFCNLECTVAEGGQPFPKPYSFRADPKLAADVLAAGGITVAALANNHTYDYGRPGLAKTLATLNALQIAAPGAGIGRAGAVAPRVLACNGLRVAFVAYTCLTPEYYLPSDDGAALATFDEDTFAEELRAAKAQADVLVVSLHWGQEYANDVSPRQREIARAAVDAGADLILGHHPHVAQPAETYKDRPILYSLGNCIFDRSGNHTPGGALARVRLTKGAITLERLVTFTLEDARPLLPRSRRGAGGKGAA